MSSTVVKVKLPRLHPAQLAILRDLARFKVICTGRRFGKGIVSTVKCIKVAAGLAGKVWHISPDFPTSSVEWRLLKYMVRQLPDVTIREDERYIEFGNGGYIQVKSAQQTLRSEGLHLAVIDEAAHIPNLSEVWNEQIRPSLADYEGEAWFTSTPFGLNYYYTLFGFGVDPTRAEWSSFHFPSSANPHLKSAEIEAMRASMTERAARQEIDAEFLADAGAVFRFVNEVSILQPEDVPMEGHRYVIGLDTGRSNDYTVASVFDATSRRQVAMDRFSGVSWEMQRDRIKVLNQRWRPAIILCEINGIGQPQFESLDREGLPVVAWTATADSKAQVIEGLSLAIERGYAGDLDGVHLLDDPIQKGELLAYALERLPSGKYRYSAPTGQHDDTVVAAALAVYAVGHSLVTPVFDNFAPDRHVASAADYSADDPLHHLVFWSIQDGYSIGGGPGHADYRPRVVLVAQQVPNGGLTIIGELYQCGEPDYQVTFDAVLALGFRAPDLVYVDKVGGVAYSEVCKAAAAGKLHQVSAADCDLSEGIRTVRSALTSGRLHISPRCTNLIREIQAYQFDAAAPSGGDSRPLAIDDHGPLALARLCWKQRFN